MERWIAIGLLVALTAPAAATAAEQTATVARKDCKRVVRHSPAPDVAYKPGVDVRGRKVAPADLGGGYKFELPDEITFDLTVDLAARLGIPSTAGGFEAAYKVGKVSVRGGRVYLDGKQLAPEEQVALEAACRELMKKDKRK